jgi:hypothetical protein
MNREWLQLPKHVFLLRLENCDVVCFERVDLNSNLSTVAVSRHGTAAAGGDS